MADQSRIITRKAVKEDMADVILMIQVRKQIHFEVLVLVFNSMTDKTD